MLEHVKEFLSVMNQRHSEVQEMSNFVLSDGTKQDFCFVRADTVFILLKGYIDCV